jgi:hypothetical protein
MSSPPADGSSSKRTRQPFEQWRKIMLLGAFILLARALGDALIDGQLPTWAALFLNFVGYGFLAVGFGTRMREMKAAKEQAAAAKKESGELES